MIPHRPSIFSFDDHDSVHPLETPRMARERGIAPCGATIRKYRKQLSITQEEMAAKADCSVRTLRTAENGGPVDASTLSRLAGILRLPVHEISIKKSNENSEERHRRIAMEWEDAFFHGDLDRILPLHQPDVITVVPGQLKSPWSGEFRGRSKLRDHFVAFFSTFKSIENQYVEFSCIGEKVFLRSHSLWRVRSNPKAFSSVWIHEFRFGGGLIAHRVSVTDTGIFRDELEPRSPVG